MPFEMDCFHPNEKLVFTTDVLDLEHGLLPSLKDSRPRLHCYKNKCREKELRPRFSHSLFKYPIRHICSYCDKSFNQEKNLMHHIKKYHNANVKCLECDLKFLSTLALETHIKKIHKEKMCKVCESANRPKDKKYTVCLGFSDETLKKLHCRYCHKSFSFCQTLNNHIDSFHKKIRPYHCKQCNSSFKQRGHYSHHMNSVHLKLKPYKCDDCDRYFSTCVNLARHVTILHQKLHPIKCKHCLNEATFSDKAALNKHYESVHRPRTKSSNRPIDKKNDEMIKKYRCSECEKSFAWSKSLKNHIESFHMNIKPYHCEDCNSSFSQKGHYTHHMKSVHLKIKPFNCKECDLSFSTRVSLARHTALMHQKIHPVKCKHCSFEITFCDKAALKKHYESIHQQPKLLSCKICDKDFANNKTLWKHNARYHHDDSTQSRRLSKLDNEKVEYRIITEGFTEPLVIINEEIGIEFNVEENAAEEKEDFIDNEYKNYLKESEVVNNVD